VIFERRNGRGRVRRMARKWRKLLASVSFGKKPSPQPPPRGPGPFDRLGRVLVAWATAPGCSASGEAVVA
jgi:hypothetical protein